MGEQSSSKAQNRVLDLLSVEHDGTYSHAARTLAAMGIAEDAVPVGQTWRTAAKLDDATLLAAPGTASAPVAVATTADARRETVRARIADRKEQSAYWADVRDGKIQRDNPEPFTESGGLLWENE